METNVPGTRQKALQTNLDPRTYGTFAEIGAGQEVAAQFFKAGAASGTIAKTMSAYDMTFSDAIYGKEASGRYVCESRLVKMLSKEYSLLEERLKGIRPPDTLFFSFATTVTTINFNRTNEGHGWLGVRFQLTPNSKPNEMVVHVKLSDTDTMLQQQAVGVLGVNMVYACFYLQHSIDQMIISLLDSLGSERIEIDMLRLSGPEFESVDNRLIALKLVKNGLTNAALFGPNKDVLQASEIFYKKNIIVTRGRFRPPTLVNEDIFSSSLNQFLKDKDVNGANVIQLSELTLTNLRTDGDINENDFLDRADILCSMGEIVLVSNYHEYYRLVSYLSNETKGKIGIVLGYPNLSEIFNEEYYTNLKGGILESFAILFSKKVKLYIYPSINAKDNSVNTVKSFKLEAKNIDLFQYLLVNDKLEDIEGANLNNLHIYSDAVLKMIRTGQPNWEQFVPVLVAKAIKKNKLFGYK